MVLGARTRFLSGLGAVALALPACRASPTPDENAPPVASRIELLSDTTWPTGPFGASVRRGHALLAHTPDSLPQYAPGGLRCVNCHMDDGMRKNGIMLIGVSARYPQYRSRNGRVDLLADRVNDCFTRSLNGHALPADGPDMRDIVAYLTWLSRGVPLFDSIAGQGLPKLAPLAADTARGAALFTTTCARCHGLDGNGGPGGKGVPVVPPLWGPRSFNIGAGMARLNTIAAFVRFNMPYDKPESLTDQQAFDVAAYIVSRPRPDFAGKENDWPNGDPPSDVAYRTTAAQRRGAAAARTTPTSAH
jgi:thiosulfate dehydrogenase